MKDNPPGSAGHVGQEGGGGAKRYGWHDHFFTYVFLYFLKNNKLKGNSVLWTNVVAIPDL